ncbi:MAG: ABC transporter permease [Propionibacteriaceae bacterium]|jgi:ABC-2 type transport system permease protein|nr:ABC transporter permease [Propionibacteriaceae bacterium]
MRAGATDQSTAAGAGSGNDGIGLAARPAGLVRAIILLTARQLRATARQPVWVIAGLTTPLLYLALFAPLLDTLAGGQGATSNTVSGALGAVPGYATGNVIDGFLPGMLALFAFGTGTGVGWTVIAELNAGVTERLRVTPTPRLAMLLGSVIKDMAMFAFPAALVVAVAAIFGFDIHWGGLALTFALLALLTAAVSAASAGLGLKLRQIGSLAAVVTGLQLPITLLSGALLPMSLGPAWLRALAHANPLYYATAAARDLCSGVYSGTAALGFAVTGALVVAALAWARSTYNRALA